MKSKQNQALVLLAGLLLVWGCGTSNTDSKLPPATGKMGAGVITGKVSLIGKIPTRKKIDMSADPICQGQHAQPVYDQSVVADSRGDLANVLVYVSGGAAVYDPPKAPVTLLQTGCMYAPHVFGVQAGQKLDIFNEDATMHNVHALDANGTGFNVAQGQKGDETEQEFMEPEMPVTLKCDVHGWMRCYGGVFTHPFFTVTGQDGTFKIKGLPTGTYDLTAWQEKYGFSKPQTVKIQNGKAEKVNFKFKAD
ncbi:MAG: hypothetical protein ACREL1_05550 [bacterium]